GYPFNDQVADFIRRDRRVYVVEQNRDAQLAGLMRLDLEDDLVRKLRSVLHYDGLPIDARSVTDSIFAQEAER
ncbi:MAG TPA: 2-oxoacid:acceptor oxidoreductase subunit alpha, partial [Terriglobia bacterium]|nr:2-oxoacid:acceptor oxidoreductase subunit alpha [Terriglobia bacterium]